MNEPFKISRSEPYLHNFPEWFRRAPAHRWLVEGAGERDLVVVECIYLHDLNTVVQYLADQVTGTLYNPESLACLSSSNLRLAPIPRLRLLFKPKAPFKPVPM